MSGGQGPHGALFRLALLLVPRRLREAHGEEMAELFRVRLGRTRGTAARVGLWARTIRDLMGTGWAMRRARLRGPEEGKRRGGMGALGHDIRDAARHLIRTPLFTVAAVALLAVGIGANTAVFTVVNGILLRPPPYANPDRVVAVYQDSDDGKPSSTSFPAYRDMAASKVFSAVAATSPAQAALETDGGPVQVQVDFTTSDYLDVLGLAPSRGRWLPPEADEVGGPMVAVVSYPAWQSRFGADPGLVGRTIRLNGHPVTVVGVGPRKLSGTYVPVVTDFWLSISSTPLGGAYRVTNLQRREDHWYDVRARLAPATTVPQAQAAMDALAARLAEEYPELNRGREITVFSARDIRFHPQEDGSLYSAGAVLMTVVGLILILACGNLANLLLVRGLGRSGEVAVRRALGAGGLRVARQFLAESLLLSLMGGVTGVLLARWLLGLLHFLPLPYPLSAGLDLGIDGRVLLFSGGLMVVTGVLFGLAPALRSARTDVASVLRDEARTASMGRGTARLSRLLVALQVAVSLVLVLGAGLLGRSLVALRHVDTGVDADRVAYVRTDFSQSGITGEEIGVVLSELRERMASIPGVTEVGATTRLPAQQSGTTTTVVDGYVPPTGTGAVELDFAVVTPGYFPTVGLSVVQGRDFGPDDAEGTETVVLVNETAARRFWGGADPIGRRLRAQSRPDAWRSVIGVVQDAPVQRLGEAPRPMFYFTARQAPPGSVYLLARTDGDPETLLAPMRTQLSAVRSSLPVSAQGTLASHFGEALSTPRFAATSMGVFSLLALLLASLGIYAVVAFGVARRSAELGIRMALGAERGGMVRMVVSEVWGTVTLGLVAGVGLAWLGAPRLGAALFGVAPLDLTTFVGSVLVLLAVSGVAAYLPARSAARVDPVEALRR